MYKIDPIYQTSTLGFWVFLIFLNFIIFIIFLTLLTIGFVYEFAKGVLDFHNTSKSLLERSSISIRVVFQW
jgi:hypothetical protein